MQMLKFVYVVCLIAATLSVTGCQLSGTGDVTDLKTGSFVSGPEEMHASSPPPAGPVAEKTKGLGGGAEIPHNPEPATAALMGIGAAAYAFMQRRKKKKK